VRTSEIYKYTVWGGNKNLSEC